MTMDWTCPEVIDVVWSHLASWEGIWAYWEDRFPSPLSMILTIRGIATATRHASCLKSVWRSIARPYLSRTSLQYAGRVLLCEYAVRRFVQSVTDVFDNDARSDVKICFAGGFASWELERQLHTMHNLDALPRCATFFHDGITRNDLWVPSDIDVFFTGDADLVLPVIQEAYMYFCQRLFRRLRMLNVCMMESSSMYEWMNRQDESGEDPSILLQRTMTDAHFPPMIVDEAVLALKERDMKMASRDGPILLKTWRLCSRMEPVFPTDINIIQTKCIKKECPFSYSQLLRQSFDFVHCCVSMTVDDEQGNWTFEHEAEVINCLKHRLLRFNTSANALLTVHRLIKYYRNGFTFRGNTFYYN